MDENDLIVARYNEDPAWLLKVPADWRIFLYNKGDPITDPKVLQRIDVLEDRPNYGREADSYLAHIASRRSSDARWVVFAQGDPFPHSPDFLALLDSRNCWNEIQSLSVQWLEDKGIPPRLVIEKERNDWLGELRLRKEWFSLGSWGPVSFCDDGAVQILKEYLNLHGVPEGSNLAEHFLRLAAWDELAEKAGAADLGRFCYGAIFAVKGERLSAVPELVLGRMRELALSHNLHGYIFERLWLHFFGEPFVKLEAGNADRL
jgi:hypothetical protein